MLKTVIASILCLLCVAACSSSGSNGNVDPTVSCDAQCQSNISAACGTDCIATTTGAAAAPDANEARTDPDHMTCADWAVTSPDDQKYAAAYFAVEFKDPQPTSDVDSLAGIINSVCSAYKDSETPRHAAQVGLRTVYSS